MKIKYFDNAATTKMDESLLPIFTKYATEEYFNPSALSSKSTQISKDIANARETLANTIGANFDEITFVSCGTEGDNMAMMGTLKGYKGNIVTSKVEHSAVYNTATFLQSKGIEVRFVELEKDGRVKEESLSNLVDKDTQYVCLMHVNNETGAINDIKTLCSITKSKNDKCIFICDGVQAYGKINVNVKNLGIDFYVTSGHKINGPKGIGFIYHKKNLHLAPLIKGGGQESGLRSGTENVSNIIAFAKAGEVTTSNIQNNSQKYALLKQTILDILCQNCNDFVIATQEEYCSPSILSIFFANIKTEVLLHMLENDGFIFGTGSACNSKNKTSRIISALKIESKYKEGLVRISFDKYSTQEDAKEFALKLSNAVNALRKTINKK